MLGVNILEDACELIFVAFVSTEGMCCDVKRVTNEEAFL
jgi:hypothetical protein